MGLRSLLRSLFVVFIVCGTGVLHAAVQDRVVAAISTEQQATLAHNVHAKALAATDLGAADGALKLNNMTLRFSLSDAQQAALTELLLEQQQPGSANYHKWLTPEQYAAQFGMSANDLAKVSAWLTSQGFTVTGTARGGSFISFSGTAAQVQHAFATTIHTVSIDGETHYANLTDPVLPAAISGVVSGMTGLHDFKLKPHLRTRVVQTSSESAVHPEFTSSISGSHYIAPGDIYTIYDENALLNNSINGSGVTIAVVGQVDVSLSDVAAFRSASGLSANLPTIKLYGTDPGAAVSNTSTPSLYDLSESQLDLEWAGATAPSANILFVNSTDVLGISLTQAIDNNIAPIISTSYGDCEVDLGYATLNSYNQLFQQANAEGITLVGAGGDTGAADCDYESGASAQYGYAVDFPASSPYVTGVGGTMFNEGTGSYWNSNSSSSVSNAGSAISYIPEAVWNETAVLGELSAGGGGVSLYFSKPSWQTGTGVPTGTTRDVPDIALDAAVSHDGYLYCAEGFCVNGFRSSSTSTTTCPTGGCLDTIGGTSVGTPSFAGMLALVEQKTGSRLGNANPTIYALANSTYYSSIFHDVTTGNNAVPCTAGTTNCATGGTIGYSATTGYDLASGWGSIDAFNLVNDWNLYTGATTTALTTATPSVTVGTTIAFTATVASSSSTSTTAPAGLVQLLVDGTANGTPVTLTSGAVTLTLTTTSLSIGTHTVTAAYLGGTSYAASTATMTITIKASVATTPSVTAITIGSVNVTYGATLAFPVTVASGTSTSTVVPTGTVQLMVDGTASGSAIALLAGTATFQLSTSGLTTGTHTVTAVYSGDGTYVTSTGSVTINIGDFSLTGSPTTITVKSGSTAAGVTYTLSSLYNFAGTVSLQASSSTLNASAYFTPATVTLTAGGSGTSVFTLTAAVSNGRQSIQTQASSRPTSIVPWQVGGGGIAVASLFLILLPGRRRRLTRFSGVLSLVVLSALAAGLSGCGSSSSSASTGTSNSTTGTYAVTITASSGAVSHVTTLTVVVQ